MWIPPEIYHSKEIHSTAKLILAEIVNLLKVNTHCWASNEHFADLLGIEKANVSYHIQQLTKFGWITSQPVQKCLITDCPLKHKGWHRHISPTPTLSNILESLSKPLDTLSSKTGYPIKSTPVINNTREIYKEINNEITTNVESTALAVKSTLQKLEYGNPDINEGIRVLETLLGYKPSLEQKNRYALNRLFKKRGKEKTLKVMRYAFSLRDKPYAPSVSNYLDLEQKWEHLESYARRKTTGGVGAVMPDHEETT